MPQKRELQ